MEIHLGVIRDKQEIYAALLQSQALNRQLAICYNSGGKLLVKICTVANVTGRGVASRVTISSQPNTGGDETTITLDDIQSIYPICDFI